MKKHGIRIEFCLLALLFAISSLAAVWAAFEGLAS